MATQLFLGTNNEGDATSAPDMGDRRFKLLFARAAGINSRTDSTVAGPTSGVQVGTNTQKVSWWLQVNAVTISAAITKNIWGAETNMAANAGYQFIIERWDATSLISTVQNSERGTEMAVTTRAVNNWNTGTVTSTTFAAGDWLRVYALFNDVGTMASGHSVDTSFGGTSAGADGDSYVTFTETITEFTPAADRYAGHNAPTIVSDAIRRAANRFRSFRKHDELWLPDRRRWAPRPA